MLKAQLTIVLVLVSLSWSGDAQGRTMETCKYVAENSAVNRSLHEHNFTCTEHRGRCRTNYTDYGSNNGRRWGINKPTNMALSFPSTGESLDHFPVKITWKSPQDGGRGSLRGFEVTIRALSNDEGPILNSEQECYVLSIDHYTLPDAVIDALLNIKFELGFKLPKERKYRSFFVEIYCLPKRRLSFSNEEYPDFVAYKYFSVSKVEVNRWTGAIL